VPVQAVTRVANQAVCYLPGRAKPRCVPVKVGLTNTTRAQIISGLQEGDLVLLAPPIGEEATAQALGIPGVEVPAAEAAQSASPSTSGQGQPAAAAKGAEAGKAPEQAPTPAAQGKIDEILAQVPAAERERVKQRWEAASPQERQRMIERFKNGGQGGGGRPSGGRQRPRE